MDHLNYETGQRTSKVTALAAQFAGQMALRLTHDHLVRLDVTRYGSDITKMVTRIYQHIVQLSSVSVRPHVTSSFEEQNILILRGVIFLILFVCFAVWSAEGSES